MNDLKEVESLIQGDLDDEPRGWKKVHILPIFKMGQVDSKLMQKCTFLDLFLKCQETWGADKPAVSP